MGNRAVITFEPYNENNVGIYVHWNGGRASVEGFLNACKELKCNDPCDDSYGITGMIYAICLFFNYDGSSIGVDVCKNLDENNSDNGVYVIGKDFKIVDRIFFEGEEEVNAEKTATICNDIIKKANKAFLRAKVQL